MAVVVMERVNHLQNLSLDGEHDWAYPIDDEKWPTDEISRVKLILCGDTETGILEDSSYIYVDPDYQGELSIGQRQLYEVLLGLQRSAVYTVTTIGKLTEAIDSTVPWSCVQRLENLQSLGAISGYKG